MPVAIASSSRLAADAGAQVARQGGNAVDAAIASVLVQLVSEPGVVSPSAAGFVTVWAPGDDPVTIDGGSEMPGRGAPRERWGHHAPKVRFTYGGGMETRLGPGSVATVGGIAALGVASKRWGRLPWATLVAPAIAVARDGFPLPPAAHRYLVHTFGSLFAASPEAGAMLLGDDGQLVGPGERIHVPDLEASFRALADEGPDCFTTGSVGRRIADYVAAAGGLLGREDHDAYEVRVRPALCVDLDGWGVATCPQPSIGGALVAAMLLGMRDPAGRAGPGGTTADLVRVTDGVLGFRDEVIRPATDLPPVVRTLLESAAAGTLPRPREAPSTVHTSTVDTDGLACAVTASAGYGAGLMAPDTGIWLNNALGELELTPEGLHALPPGARLRSNMAPTVARRTDGSALAIGSPGADRITTAIVQTLVHLLYGGLPLDEAVAHPRLHLEPTDGGGRRIAHEPGLAVDGLGLPTRPFDALDMFFGGVALARFTPPATLSVAADPRRTGGTAVV